MFKAKFPKGKLVVIKGMNRLKTPPERRAETQALIKRELDRLHAGYNPIHGLDKEPSNVIREINPFTPFIQALQEVRERVKGSPSTHRDLRSIMRFVTDAASPLQYTNLPVKDIKRKHVKTILQQIEVHKGESPHRYNKVRAYLMILFNELVELEAVEANPVKDVAKQKLCHKLRRLLSREQRREVNNFLKQNHYRFWLFLNIFSHSGARLTEVVGLQRKNINIEQQFFIVTARKGRIAKEVVKPIKDVALSFWKEVVHGATDDDFTFQIGSAQALILLRAIK